MRLLVCFILLLGCCAFYAQAQNLVHNPNNDEDYSRLDSIERSCAHSIPSDYKIVKTYRFNLVVENPKSYQISQSYIFSSTSKYYITICGGWDTNTRPNIYVFDSKNNKLAESKSGWLSLSPSQGGMVRIVYEFRNLADTRLMGSSIIASAARKPKAGP